MERRMNSQIVGKVAAAMLDYVENNKTFMTDKSMTVPTRSYLDADQWGAEMELIFKRVPLMLALSCEMPKPGDYKAMEAIGLPILIARDREGAVRAFLNVCSHRGAPVAKDGHGNCSRFTCVYHGWTFATDGRLMGVADPHKFGDVDKSTRGLKRLPCEERHGMIFVVLTPNAPLDLDAYYGDLLDDYSAAGLKDWTFLGSRVIAGANWKIAFDGYLEGYHFAQLHPDTIHPRTPSNVMHYEGFGPNIRIGFPQRSIGKLRDIPKEKWGEQENNGFDFVRIFFPNVSAFLAPELAQIAQLFPGPTPDKNRTVLLYARKEPPKDDADRANIEAMINFLRDVTYKEDYLLGLDIQRGLQSGAHQDLVFGRNERGNQYFHEWVNWYLQDDPTLPKPTL
jgi:phenylpropionate dioxygenase-like ring-hydroxylating dioxygenase large terminal subunit